MISRSPTDLQPVFETHGRERGPAVRAPSARSSSASTARLLRLVAAARRLAGGARGRSSSGSHAPGRRQRRRAGRSCERRDRPHPRRPGRSRVHVRPSAASAGCPDRAGASRCSGEGELIGVDRHLPARGPAVHRQADRAAGDLRRPGRHRHRERAAASRSCRRANRRPHRGAGAADGDRRDPARHRQLADRRPAGLRRRSSRARRSCAAPTTALVFAVDGELIRLASLARRAAGGAARPCGARSRCRPDAGTRRPAGRSSTGAVVHIPDVRDGPASTRPDAEWPASRRPDAASACRCSARATPSASIVVARHGAAALHRQPDRAAGDVRRPGRHRHRERPAVRGAGGAQPRARARRWSSRRRPARSSR